MIENRSGTCRTCGGPAYRVPNQIPDTPDRWVHRNTADWIGERHDVDPAPADDSAAS